MLEAINPQEKPVQPAELLQPEVINASEQRSENLTNPEISESLYSTKPAELPEELVVSPEVSMTADSVHDLEMAKPTAQLEFQKNTIFSLSPLGIPTMPQTNSEDELTAFARAFHKQ